ncbi:MAG: nitroreductase family protein [Bacteroidales bacterium]
MKRLIIRLLSEKQYRSIRHFFQKIRLKHELKQCYKYDLSRYYCNNATVNESSSSLLSKIVKEYHALEKGLTMPDFRLGFGRALVLSLINHCIEYSQRYDSSNKQLIHAVSVVLEYDFVHIESQNILDNLLKQKIEELRSCNISSVSSIQRDTSSKDLFSFIDSPFPQFANSRCSVRNFSNEEIPMERLNAAIELARSTPSSCNRQCWRTYVFTDKAKINQILDIQGGSRGFGHLTNKLVVIVSETSVFSASSERNQMFVDGGIYTMNLLYCLHYYQIAACTLNCCFNVDIDKQLRKICGIKESEVFVAMLSCGIPQNFFKVAYSKRVDIECTNRVIK